jgi:hypothetical protein
MRLSQLATAVAAVNSNHAVLLYGPPKSGKTVLVATAAKIPEIKTLYWFDLENGIESLLNMGLTAEEMDKIVVIKVRDTRDNPIGVETILKAFSAKKPIKICEEHGRVDCAECTKDKKPFIEWCLAQCTHNDLVVIDSGSQLGDSALAAACLGKPQMFKPTFDEYGMVNKWLGDIMSVVQQATHTNFAVITHEIPLEDNEGKDKIYPLMGSKQFSSKCAKFFGTVAYIHKKMNKHVAGSSSTYRGDLLTGSRVNAMLEKADKPDMRTLLIDAGIIKVGSTSAPLAQPNPDIPAALAEVAAIVAKPMSLAERLAHKKQ